MATEAELLALLYVFYAEDRVHPVFEGGFVSPFTVDGVHMHVDTVNREGGYETALKNGMYPILGIKNIKKREKLCLRCHTSERPCYPTDPKEIYRQSISLQTIAEMRKGDLNLKHPLIPPFPQY